jgi:hypothetical protein
LDLGRLHPSEERIEVEVVLKKVGNKRIALLQKLLCIHREAEALEEIFDPEIPWILSHIRFERQRAHRGRSAGCGAPTGHAKLAEVAQQPSTKTAAV